MQIRRRFIGVLLLLAVILLIPQVSTAYESPRTPTQVPQNQRETGCRAQVYQQTVLPLPNSNAKPGQARSLELLAQDQPPSAATPEQTTPEEKLDLSERLTLEVFEPLQRGIQGHNLDQVLSVFDRQDMPDYAQLSDQLRAFFEQYDALRFRYQLLQATSNKNHATAVAEITMDANPLDPAQVTLRRETQMRFRMTLGPKGWKLVGFTPADFFAK